MNWKRLIVLTAVTVLLIAVAAVFALPRWREHVRESVAQRHLLEAQTALSEKHYAAAMQLAQPYLTRRTDARHPSWAAIEIEALAGLRRAPQLMQLYETDGWLVADHPQASLLVARGFLASGKTDDFNKLLETGTHELPMSADWKLLKADAFLSARQWIEARQWLETQLFSGSAEAARLCRLAMIKAHDGDLAGSWALLNSAKDAAPEDADVHSFRAQMLEAAGRQQDALSEYEAAIEAQPFNPLLQDQLADYHLRYGRHDAALKILRTAAAMPHPDYMRLKTLFWGHVIDGKKIHTENNTVRSRLSPVIELIENHPALDATDAFTLPQPVRDRPEVFWLTLVQLLRQHREQEALDALGVCPAQTRMLDPDLHEALTIACEWRLARRLPGEFSQRVRLHRPRHQFLDQLHASLTKPDAECLAVLESPHVWSACFMACDWREAALQLMPGPQPASHPPSWLIYGMAQCVRFNQGADAALRFIEKQPLDSPENQLLHAEILLIAGDAVQGMEIVQRLQLAQGAVGERARVILLAASLPGSGKSDAPPSTRTLQ